MTMEINNFQDILNAMERDPALANAMRRHILTDELLKVPARLVRIEEDIGTLKDDMTTVKEDLQGIKEDVKRIAADVGDLKGNVAGRVAWDRHEDILAQLDLSLVRMLSNADLNNLANRSDTTGIHRFDLLSFYRADLVMEALDHDNNTHYVAMEASYTADKRDTDRESRNAGFLIRFTG